MKVYLLYDSGYEDGQARNQAKMLLASIQRRQERDETESAQSCKEKETQIKWLRSYINGIPLLFQ